MCKSLLQIILNIATLIIKNSPIAMSHKPAIKYITFILVALISCNKKIVYNKDKSCFFRKDLFCIEGIKAELTTRKFYLTPWEFYKFVDSLLPVNTKNFTLDDSDYYVKRIFADNRMKGFSTINGCNDSMWMAKVLIKEYEKKLGLYRIDTLFPIDIYDAKIVDSSKLHIVPVANYNEDDLDSLFSLTKGGVVVSGELIEDETLPGNKIYYNVGGDSLGSFFDNFNTPHTMLLNSIRRRTSPQYTGGIVDYVIKENKIGPSEKRININYRIHGDIFKCDDKDKKYIHHKVGPEAFIKYCKDYHGVEVWLDRTDTFLVKKIKFRK
jgi:hypothetical protein